MGTPVKCGPNPPFLREKTLVIFCLLLGCLQKGFDSKTKALPMDKSAPLSEGSVKYCWQNCFPCSMLSITLKNAWMEIKQYTSRSKEGWGVGSDTWSKKHDPVGEICSSYLSKPILSLRKWWVWPICILSPYVYDNVTQNTSMKIQLRHTLLIHDLTIKSIQSQCDINQ